MKYRAILRGVILPVLRIREGGIGYREPVSDDAFYRPNHRSPPPRPPTPGERLWELRREHVTWSAEIRFLGESYGWDVRLLRDGEFTMSHHFLLREPTIRCSEDQRHDIERGWLDSTDESVWKRGARGPAQQREGTPPETPQRRAGR